LFYFLFKFFIFVTFFFYYEKTFYGIFGLLKLWLLIILVFC